MTEQLEISTLGGLSLRYGPLELTEVLSGKALALIVFLACTKRPQTRLRLAELFWFERSEEQALSNLRTLLSRIRPYLGNHLIVTRESVSFNPNEPYRLDLAELQAVLASARSNQDGYSLELIIRLEEALNLYRGDFLAGFFVSEANGFEEWASQERETLHSQVLEAFKIAIAYRLKQNDFNAAYRWASRLLEIDPFNEQALRQQMLILVHEGRRSAALGKYRTYQQYLAKELDIAPEAQTTDLYEQITNDLEPSDEPENLAPASTDSLYSSKKAVLEQLKRVSLFAQTPDYLLTELTEHLEEDLVKAGQVIFEKGDSGECLYIIVEGQVRVYDRDKVINDLGPRDIFGEMAVLDTVPRLASVKALTDTRLWRLDQANLYYLMSRRIEVVRAIIKMLSGRLRDRVNEVVELNAQLVNASTADGQ